MKPAPTAAPAPAPPETGVVRLDSVELRFEQNWVLRGVTLQVPIRERLVILGQSGGGKSTLLRLILGILKPTKGSVKFKGLEVTRMGRRRLNKMRQKIGMVYQYSALISSLSVRENFALPLDEFTVQTTAVFADLVMDPLVMVCMNGARVLIQKGLSGVMCKCVGCT